MGNISPQRTFGEVSFPGEPLSPERNHFSCIEPDYRDWIDVKMIRRMSRIIRMGVTAALSCLREAGNPVPGAIITGTAYGCLEDTGLFVRKMVEQKEEMLTPTAFIQSTHNTVGAQIALILHCKGYNNTFVHRAHSFESALLDAKMLLEENKGSDILVGGLDEITPLSRQILERMGLYKREPLPGSDIFSRGTRGVIGGEGAAFFLFSSRQGKNDYARLDGFTTFYKPADKGETERKIRDFLDLHRTGLEEIDLLITGNNGDAAGDRIYDQLGNSVFRQKNTVHFKQLCGEYPTAVSFAIWLAAKIIKSNQVPASLGERQSSGKALKKILVYNQSWNIHHSLFLLSAC